VAVQEFRLPDPGEGLVEAEIVTWRVAVGDRVEVNDIVVEVETSKSLVELPSPYAGTVRALLVSEGDLVDVGKPIISIDDALDDSPGALDDGTAEDRQEDVVPPSAATAVDGTVEASEVAEGTEAPGGRVAVLVGYGPRTTEAKRRPRKAARSEGSLREAQDSAVETREQAARTFSTEDPVSRRADVITPLPPDQAEPVGAPLPRPGAAAREPEPARTAILAKPPVRKLAKDLGVDLATVIGTGPGGVITRDDITVASQRRSVEGASATVASQRKSVEGASARELSVPPNQAPPSSGRFGSRTSSEAAGDVRLPIKGVRKATADAMVRSAFTAPHVTEWVTCDVTATMELVERLKTRREFSDVRVSPLLIVAKAVCLALGRTPELNSSWDEPAGEIVLHGSVNLGIAAATPRGLLVPNIKGAGQLSLAELAQAIHDLVATARAGTTQPAATSGGTFTITNVGVFGVDAGTPILNPGEAGILCIGQIARRPWVLGSPSTSSGPDERIEPRWVMTLALSFDHRLVDGEQGSGFLADVAGMLTDPGLALLY
jgi:2-oxoisovalerate dehydrogenase E2 component (dihydrolipoyl transacylase)